MKIALLIAFFLLLSLALTLDFSLLLKTIASVNPLFLLLSALPIVLEIVIKSMRLRALVCAVIPISLRSAIIVTLVGFPFGTVTPGRIGDLVKIHTLSQKTSLPLAQSFAIGFFEKVLELFSLALLVLFGIIGLSLSGIFGKPLAFLFIAALLIILFLVLAFNRKLTKKFLRYIIFRFLPFRYRTSLEQSFENFYSTLTVILSHIPTMTRVIFLSLLLWINRILQVFILSLALGMEVQLLIFSLIMPIAFLAEIIPITIMGLGVREYLYLFLFSLVGITQETSVVLSLLVFSFGILPPAFIGYVVVLKHYGGITKLRQSFHL